jgi:hypothetical protein
VRLLAALLSLVAITAFADTAVVVVPGKWVLRDPADTSKDARYDTQALCEAAAKATLTVSGTYQCNTSVTLKVTVTCPAKPDLPRTLDADGYVIKPPMRAKQLTETDWTTELQDFVPAPAPACWVLGWREITQVDVDDDEYPDVAMVEPVIWPGDVVLP